MKKPKSKISKAIEIVGSIDDLLIQIFVHLPLKPLVRFKTVSKHWNSIISDPGFHLMRNQVHNNSPAVGLFIHYHRWLTILKETRFVSLSSNPPHPHPRRIPKTLQIFHSCNGLFVLKKEIKSRFKNVDYYYVYNPTTKQKPRPLLKDGKKGWAPDCVHGMYLAFDPSKSPHYKVVCLWMLIDQYQFEVYSSETGSWGMLEWGLSYDFCFDKGVYWNGAIHWPNRTGDSISLNLDDDDEMPRVLPKAPIHFHDNMRDYYFGESCGHLHCAVVVGEKHSLHKMIYVYEMRRDYSEWFLKFRVEYDFSQCFLQNKFLVLHLQSVVRGKEDEDSFLVLGNGQGEMIRYNLVHNTFQTIQVKGLNPGTSMVPHSSFQYIESLCSV